MRRVCSYRMIGRLGLGPSARRWSAEPKTKGLIDWPRGGTRRALDPSMAPAFDSLVPSAGLTAWMQTSRMKVDEGR
jgi:hypothetical protein